MAQKRMFSMQIIDSDAFLDMPQSSQLLYFHLSMRADDDGFIGNPKRIMRDVRCNDDDIKVLVAKHFVIPFENGIVVIKHWKINNYLRSDRYKSTIYTDEKAQLTESESGVYALENKGEIGGYTVGIPSGTPSIGEGSKDLGKGSVGEPREGATPTRFTPPTLDEVSLYCRERNNKIDPQTFIDFYESKGWLVGRTKMKCWKASVRTWEKRPQYGNNGNGSTQGNDTFLDMMDRA